MLDSRYMTWGLILDRSTKQYPDVVAVKDDRAKRTYREFNDRVNRLANAFEEVGLAKKDRIATLSKNCVELMEMFFAALKAGVVPCPLDARGTKEDKQSQMRLVEPKAIAFHPDYAEEAHELIESHHYPLGAIELGFSEQNQCKNTEKLIADGTPRTPLVDVFDDDLAFIPVSYTHLTLPTN